MTKPLTQGLVPAGLLAALLVISTITMTNSAAAASPPAEDPHQWLEEVMGDQALDRKSVV